MTEISQNFWKG